ncbi:MAG TPA: ABC transporter substrate-binding protein, partial [Burkholderiaceae bacterium]|nr:ABC transporter substrate-binding protein [Burkholderiaceae bacterium]
MRLMVFRCVIALATALATNVTSAQAQAPKPELPREQKPPRKLERITLQLKWKHQFQFAGYYAAVEKGYYRDAGFDVTLAEPSGAEDPVDLVLAGKAQFGVGASELVLHRARGKPVVVLATILQHSPLVLLAGGGSDRTVHDLAGKRLMLVPYELELFAYLKREGVAIDGIQVVPHTFSPDDLIDGKVDALSGYSTDEPWVLRNAGLAYSVLSPRAAGIDFYGDTLFTTAERARREPERVAAFRDASVRGWQYAMAQPEEITDLIIARYSQRKPRDHLLFEAAEMRRLMQPELIEIGHMNQGRWQHIADVYTELGMLPPGESLAGFVFDPDPHVADLAAAQRRLAVAVVAALAIALLAAWQLRANRQLRREMRLREEARRQLSEANERLQGGIEDIRALQTRLEELAIRDPLTGLYNRRYLDDALERELQRAQRQGYPVSVLVIDIDRFKQMNDEYGHQAGDAVLTALANELHASVRAGDLACRWGGEEFVLVMPMMSIEAAAARAEALRAAFEMQAVRYRDS